MNKLPANMQDAIDLYAPVYSEGVILWPVRVKEWQAFGAARAALECMQKSLPVAYLSMPLLSAFYRLETDALAKNEPINGLFYSAVSALVLALRYLDGLPVEKRVAAVLIKTDTAGNLQSLTFPQPDKPAIEITAVSFQRLRPILAAQNGVELPDDDANPELVQAQRELAELQNKDLTFSIDAMRCSVAALTGIDEAEINEWPLLKLNKRAAALKRFADYAVLSLAEYTGLVKFKGGNPCPSPFFERKQDGNPALVSMAQFANGAAKQAIQNPGAGPPGFVPTP